VPYLAEKSAIAAFHQPSDDVHAMVRAAGEIE